MEMQSHTSIFMYAHHTHLAHFLMPLSVAHIVILFQTELTAVGFISYGQSAAVLPTTECILEQSDEVHQ